GSLWSGRCRVHDGRTLWEDVQQSEGHNRGRSGSAARRQRARREPRQGGRRDAPVASVQRERETTAHRYSSIRGWNPTRTSAPTRTDPTASPQTSPSRSASAADVEDTKVVCDVSPPLERAPSRDDETAGKWLPALPEARATARARSPCWSDLEICPCSRWYDARAER